MGFARLLLAGLWMALSVPVAAQVHTAAGQLESRQQASVDHCAKEKAKRGAAYKEGDCKTFYERLDENNPAWRNWALALLVCLFVLPTAFNLIFRRGQKRDE